MPHFGSMFRFFPGNPSVAISETMATHDEHYVKGVVLVLIAGCFWSIAGLVVRLMDDASEWQILFYRSLALVITLLIYLGLQNRGNLFGAFRRAGLYAVLAGAFLSIAFACWIFAMTHTTIANALFVLSAAPFLAAIFARVFIGEQVKPTTWLYMLLASLGVAVMVVEGIAVGTLAGNLLALAAATGICRVFGDSAQRQGGRYDAGGMLGGYLGHPDRRIHAVCNTTGFCTIEPRFIVVWFIGIRASRIGADSVYRGFSLCPRRGNHFAVPD